jgi:hypothetical protein
MDNRHKITCKKAAASFLENKPCKMLALRSVSTRVFLSRFRARDGADLQMDALLCQIDAKLPHVRDQLGVITRTITRTKTRAKNASGNGPLNLCGTANPLFLQGHLSHGQTDGVSNLRAQKNSILWTAAFRDGLTYKAKHICFYFN